MAQNQPSNRRPRQMDIVRPRPAARPAYQPAPVRLRQPKAPVQPARTVRTPITNKPKRPKYAFHFAAFVVLFIAVGLLVPGFFVSKTIEASLPLPKAHYAHSETVCLDPGHGGDDPGAEAGDGAITESSINLTVAQKVQQRLQDQGYQVFMTRTNDDATLSNHDRYTFCNTKKATIMVSIHHNYFTDETVDYDTALFFKAADQALADDILTATSAKLGVEDNDIASFEDGVLSKSTMPAALSESFFMTNTQEYNLLTAPGSTRLSDEAEGITNGIITYFTSPKTAQPAINPNPKVINRDE